MINVQYIPCGHVSETDDEFFIEMDKIRKEQGYIDALTLPSTMCDECEEAKRHELKLYFELDMGDE